MCEYVNVYLIDPFTCDAQIIKLNNPFTLGLDGLGENDHFNYSEFYILNVEKRGYKDDIEMIREKMSPSYMISQLENSKEFSRERSSNDASPNGTGLGMAIVQKLVRLMGGDIRIGNEPGKGNVRLKHRLAETPDPDGEMISPDEASLEGRRILLAEDNDLNAEIAVAILSSAGIAVERAEDRKRAVSAGMNAHVAKPVGIDTQRSVMSEILARHGA